MRFFLLLSILFIPVASSEKPEVEKRMERTHYWREFKHQLRKGVIPRIFHKLSVRYVHAGSRSHNKEAVLKFQLNSANRILDGFGPELCVLSGTKLPKACNTQADLQALQFGLGLDDQQWLKLLGVRAGMWNPFIATNTLDYLDLLKKWGEKWAAEHSPLYDRIDSGNGEIELVLLSPERWNSKWVIWSCGTGGCWRESRNDIRSFLSLGYKVLAFDYRAVMESTGKAPDPKGPVKDTRNAFRWLVRRFDLSLEQIEGKVLFAGTSLGGVCSVMCACRLTEDLGIPFDALAVHPFSRLSNLVGLFAGGIENPSSAARRALRILGVELNTVRSATRLAKRGGKVWVVYCTADELLPLNVGPKFAPSLVEALCYESLSEEQCKNILIHEHGNCHAKDLNEVALRSILGRSSPLTAEKREQVLKQWSGIEPCQLINIF